MSDTDLQMTFGADTSEITDAFAGVESSLAGVAASTQGLSDLLKKAGVDFSGMGDQAAKAGEKAAAAIGPIQKGWTRAATGITESFSSGLIRMAEGTESFQKLMTSVGNRILNDFVNEVIDKRVAAWVGAEATQLMASKTGQAALDAIGMQDVAQHAAAEAAKTAGTGLGVAARTTATAGGAAAGTAVESQSALVSIGTSAAKAAAGVYADVAASFGPAGPFVAPVLAGAALAAVLDFKGLVASAEGGFDIPYGVNPLTQLHQEEMVLPARFANPLRDVLSSFDGSTPGSPAPAGASSGDTHLHLHMGAGADGPSLQRWFDSHGDKLAKTLAAQTRKGARFT